MADYPTQEFMHDPDNGVIGDCWRACIAGLLSIDITDVPHFAADYPDDQWESTHEPGGQEPAWWVKTLEFVHTLLPHETLICIDPTFPVYGEGSWPVVIASGPSPRGDFMHAVLLDPVTGDLVHDPHPSRAGLAGPARDLFCIVSKEKS